jgi:hypothetical protein
MSIYPDHYHRSIDRQLKSRHNATEAITEIYCERETLERFLAHARKLSLSCSIKRIGSPMLA